MDHEVDHMLKRKVLDEIINEMDDRDSQKLEHHLELEPESHQLRKDGGKYEHPGHENDDPEEHDEHGEADKTNAEMPHGEPDEDDMPEDHKAMLVEHYRKKTHSY